MLDLRVIAEAQSWVLSRKQLTEGGMTRDAIGHSVRRGRLIKVHPGVYAVGRPALSLRGHAWAAYLATGPNAAISHEWAAWLHGLTQQVRLPVAVTTTSGRLPLGDAVHRLRAMPPTTEIDGLPVTTAHATLIALAGCVSQIVLRRLLVEAEIRRLVHHERLADEARGMRGCRQLLDLLGPGLARTASPLEDEVLDVLRAAGVAEPEVGARLLGWSVDFLWRAERVVLEADSVTYHGTATNFDRDRRKQDELEDAGYRVLRVTRQRLRRQPGRFVANVVRALSASR